MKRVLLIVSTLTVISLLLTACGAKATPEPPATEPPLTAPPATEPPATEVPTLAPIELAGPPMEVGSTFRYVDGSTLVAVPGGTFTMGYGGQDNPVHEVTLSDFWIYRHKVTNQQFAWCVAVGQCAPPDLNDNKAYTDPRRSNDPVTGVSWAQAAGYCSFVHGHLDTEAQYEKAATWDDTNKVKRTWPWGNNGPDCSLLNYNFCVGKTTPVNKYPNGASFYGLFDTAGNIFEWKADFYRAQYYNEGPSQDPLGPELGEKRSVRSSTYESGGDATIPAVRFSLKPTEHRADLGFRCVVDDPTYFAPFCESAVMYGIDANGNLLPGSDNCEKCPKLKITLGEDCQAPPGGPGAFTIVTISSNGPGPTTENVPPAPTCVGGPGVYTCYQPGGDVSASEACEVTLPGPGICPDGTVPVDGKCTAHGYPGECPIGYAYDEAGMCCTALPGTNAEFCPVGLYWADPPGACVACAAAGTATVGPVAITFDQSCGYGPGCDPTTNPNCGEPCDPQTDPYNCRPPCTGYNCP
jgi:formylglycine-generating enzyme required for sulfatase activity